MSNINNAFIWCLRLEGLFPIRLVHHHFVTRRSTDTNSRAQRAAGRLGNARACYSSQVTHARLPTYTYTIIFDSRKL